MDARIPALAQQLLLIERELRVHGVWSSELPDAQALASQEPFCVDTLRFEQWLQWIFLPRMKFILESDERLPAVSGIHSMAEVAFNGRQMNGLLDALLEFDRLIQGDC